MEELVKVSVDKMSMIKEIVIAIVYNYSRYVLKNCPQSIKFTRLFNKAMTEQECYIKDI